MHISHAGAHILVCTPAMEMAGLVFRTKGEKTMENTSNIKIQLPQQPDPRADVDDLIFQWEGWLASDR